MNVLETPEKKDEKTGEVKPARYQIQLMAEQATPDGQKRMELFTLSVQNLEPFKKLVGRIIRVPVGAFVNGKSIQYYIPKGESMAKLADGVA